MAKEMDGEQQKKLKYVMFENETNTCWLNASMFLVAHNKTFEKIVEGYPDSRIKRMISSYHEAINVLNKPDGVTELKLLKAKEMLLALQTSTLEYLRNFLKFKSGEPDSAFCALLNLIYRDKSNIKEQLNVSWIWKKHCTSCSTNVKCISVQKPFITLAKVRNFHPECPTSIYTCSCKSEQEMKLIYKELPSCLIFHFENGAGTGTDFPTSFSIKDREYKLTCIVILEKGSDFNINHFYTLIRNPVDNCWLECNDLQKKCVSFSLAKPEFNLKDVYIYVFEAFDELDKINNDEALMHLDQEVGNSHVEIIDLSDESDSANISNPRSITRASKSHKSVTVDGASKISQDFYSKIGSHIKKISSNDEIYKPSTSVENLKTYDSEESENDSNSDSDSMFPITFPSKVHESTSESIDCQDKIKKFIKAIQLKTEMCNREETSSVEKFKISSNQQSSLPENESTSNVNCQNDSATNFRLPSKISHDESDSSTCQDQVADKSKKSRVEATDSLEHKIKASSDWNTKRLLFHNYVRYEDSLQNNEKSRENNVACKIDNEHSLMTSTNPNIFSSDKREIKTNYKNLNSQDKIVIKSAKDFEIERADYSGLKDIDALVKNKKENLATSHNSDCIVEKSAAIHKELSSGKESLNKISSTSFKDISPKKEDEVDKCVKKNFQMKFTQTHLKRNEYKSVTSNSKNIQGIRDNSSSNNKKIKNNDSNQEEEMEIVTDDQAISIASADEKIIDNSVDSDCSANKSKMSDIKQCSIKTNGEIIKENDNTDNEQDSQSNDNEILSEEEFLANNNALVENTLKFFFEAIINFRK